MIAVTHLASPPVASCQITGKLPTSLAVVKTVLLTCRA
jgi:hypothetical protein